MDETLREKIALFRYGVIAELINRSLQVGEKEQRVGALVARTWEMPGSARGRIGRSTVRDWIELYQTHGFDGLKPVQRVDAGRSRAIPEPVQELLLALRAERPGASLASLIRAAQLSGRVAPTLRLTRSTVHRFFTAEAAPLAAPATTAAEPDALAFTHPSTPMTCGSATSCTGRACSSPAGATPSKTYLYALLDDAASRMVHTFAAFYLAENAACFQDALKQALLRRLGCPGGCMWIMPTPAGYADLDEECPRQLRGGPRRYRHNPGTPIPSSFLQRFQNRRKYGQSNHQGKEGSSSGSVGAVRYAEFQVGLEGRRLHAVDDGESGCE